MLTYGYQFSIVQGVINGLLTHKILLIPSDRITRDIEIVC